MLATNMSSSEVSLEECSSDILFSFFQGSIDVEEMMKIVGELYEMDGLAHVCHSSKCFSKYVILSSRG